MTAAACLRGTTCDCAETDQGVWSRPLCRQESDMKRARLLTELGPRIRREGDFDWLYLNYFLATRLASFSRKKAARARCSRGGASMCDVRSGYAEVERGACGARWLRVVL